ncbi:MAG: polyribonucleotide nucleotidyltransferase [Elusimicrobiota bacterium]
MIEQSRKSIGAVLVAALLVQTGCGTIMYPGRRGQTGGRLDAGVVVLDAIGLLFFILPGVIAFAVDFSDGTIYLSGGSKGHFSQNDIKTIHFDPRRDGTKEIESLIRENTGVADALTQPGVQSSELKTVDELPGRFAAAGTFASR